MYPNVETPKPYMKVETTGAHRKQQFRNRCQAEGRAGMSTPGVTVSNRLELRLEALRRFVDSTDNKRKGVRIILDLEPKKDILEVNRESDRLVSIKIQVDNVVIDIANAYAPKQDAMREKRMNFGVGSDQLFRAYHHRKCCDLNGHVGEGNNGSSDCNGTHGVGVRNEDGDRIVDWATAGGMALVNTYLMEREQQKFTFKTGDTSTQTDYIACRRQQLKDVLACKVLSVESVAKQHRPLLCKIKVRTIRSMQPKGIRKTKWWRLKESEYREEFVQRVETELEQGDRNWETVSDKIRKIKRRRWGKLR
ncbi:uncharacterized protein LOC122265326 [Penaeus japonicus]|uniref:uncharacterized protein LOC122265326 n=1 Tax=Penaeus japonicus TaxID=27405 RepID=UPI001C711D52|nr:uncharacterized protein LOC122265326 [Penaeus japonicus]